MVTQAVQASHSWEVFSVCVCDLVCLFQVKCSQLTEENAGMKINLERYVHYIILFGNVIQTC